MSTLSTTSTPVAVRPRVLLIEDERSLTEVLSYNLQREGYDTFVAIMLPDNRAALGLVHKLVPDATVRFAGGEYEASLPLVRAS